jgi:exodeoxyribonuclease VII small subunit
MQGRRGGNALKQEETSLEEALDSLEQIVEVLEEGKMSLEESLELYEKGMKLVALCQSRLQGAEKRIECLTGELPSDLS